MWNVIVIQTDIGTLYTIYVGLRECLKTKITTNFSHLTVDFVNLEVTIFCSVHIIHVQGRQSLCNNNIIK